MSALYHLADNLKQLRAQNGNTQQYVASQIGISCQSYQAYEWGVTVPTLKNFIKLAQFYDVSLDELIR